MTTQILVAQTDKQCCDHYKKIDSLQQVQITLLENKTILQDSTILKKDIEIKVYKKVNRISLFSLTGIILIILIL